MSALKRFLSGFLLEKLFRGKEQRTIIVRYFLNNILLFLLFFLSLLKSLGGQQCFRGAEKSFGEGYPSPSSRQPDCNSRINALVYELP